MDENIQTSPKRNTPRDLFLHLLAIVTLYWSSVTFIMLVWQYINHFFPDVLDYSYGVDEATKFAISSLVIVFPIFIATSWYLNIIYRREYAVRESRIRKWLLYLTLFIAALVIIVDLVTVINTFLNGEITIRFILKALSIIAVAAIVFWYYLDDVRKDYPTKLARPLAWISGTVVLITIIGALFIVGSPAKARLMRFDEQKIFDLQNIEFQVKDYFNVHGVLPASLSDLNNPPSDQQEGFSYEYSVKSQTNFELCATFNFATQDNARYASFPTYSHKQGRDCFERTADLLQEGV